MSVSNILDKSNLIPSALLSTSSSVSTTNLITQILVSSDPTSKITASAPDSNGIVTLGPAFLAPASGQFECGGSVNITTSTENIITFTTVNYVTPGAFTPTTSGNFTDITVQNDGVYKVSYTLQVSTANPDSQGYAYLKLKNAGGIPLTATAFQLYEANDGGGNVTYTDSVTHTSLLNLQAGMILNFVVVSNPATTPGTSNINLLADTQTTSPSVCLTISLVDYTPAP